MKDHVNLPLSEIVQNMVDALKEPTFKVDMCNWRYKKDGICFGCAATNYILRFKPEKKLLGIRYITNFEMAIDHLKSGFLVMFYYTMISAGRKKNEKELLFLSTYSKISPLLNHNYLKKLHQFKKLVKDLKKENL
jgi:hypothetical protein